MYKGEQSDIDDHCIMQQFGASAFYAVVRWHKFGQVENEYTSHNSIVLAIRVPKISEFGEDSTKFWEEQVWSFFWPTLYIVNLCTLYKEATSKHAASLASQIYAPLD